MKQILVIEDNADIQTQMKWGLSKDFSVIMASNRTSARRVFNKNQPDVVTLDLGLPPDEDGSSEGMACLREILKKVPETKVIVVTGNNERENALKAVSMGAYDYYQKPVDMNELKVIIQRAFHLTEIENENRKLHNLLNKEVGFCHCPDHRGKRHRKRTGGTCNPRQELQKQGPVHCDKLRCHTRFPS
jgi:two-component system NtrC family response regulator